MKAVWNIFDEHNACESPCVTALLITRNNIIHFYDKLTQKCIRKFVYDIISERLHEEISFLKRLFLKDR